MSQKKCKDCAMDIPKAAKICPHCRKTQGWSTGAKVALAFIILFVIAGMFGNTEKPTYAPPPEEPLSAKGKQLKAKHQGWTNEACNLVAKGHIQMGMSREQAQAAWGKPNSINSSTGSWGTKEQWVYDSNYVYFDDGILTSWQSSR